MAGFWNDKVVVITGGAGFIGSNLAPCLLERGAQVRVVDNLERGRLEYLAPIRNQIEFHQLDLRGTPLPADLLRDAAVIFHLAARVGGIGYYLQRPAEVLIENTRIDMNTWEAAAAASVPYFFYASSAHLYPRHLQAAPDMPPIVEHQAVPADPELSYGWEKLFVEKMLEYSVAQGSSTRVAIARLVGVYGPNQDIELATGSAIPVFIRRAIEYPASPFTVLGTGAETRSYCYIDDVVAGMLKSVEQLVDRRLVGPLNLGNDGRMTIREIAETVVAVSGKKIAIDYDRSWPTAIWGQTVDCGRARIDLPGWQPGVSLDQGIRRCYPHIERRVAALRAAGPPANPPRKAPR